MLVNFFEEIVNFLFQLVCFIGFPNQSIKLLLSLSKSHGQVTIYLLKETKNNKEIENGTKEFGLEKEKNESLSPLSLLSLSLYSLSSFLTAFAPRSHHQITPAAASVRRRGSPPHQCTLRRPVLSRHRPPRSERRQRRRAASAPCGTASLSSACRRRSRPEFDKEKSRFPEGEKDN